ncbi:hypothetical protein MJO28_006557 [Puccinia striiformis f. sp. tritici]|uniref:Uncharacterized protein n=1 Tax=Puccinia striiformis f. sp. tritici TaxID=168172 RepID=A0ACC0EHT0_9BASI|nr:hypothetical protein MJO28_006557 [Puccinia striiformis f. sp. tritici]
MSSPTMPVVPNEANRLQTPIPLFKPASPSSPSGSARSSHSSPPSSSPTATTSHPFSIDQLKPTPSAPAYKQMPLLPPPILTDPALPDMPDIDQLYPGPKHTVVYECESSGTAGAKKVQHQIKKSDIKKLQGRKWLNDILVQFGLEYVYIRISCTIIPPAIVTANPAHRTTDLDYPRYKGRIHQYTKPPSQRNSRKVSLVDSLPLNMNFTHYLFSEKSEIIGKARYKAVAKWTKHVDIFKKKYIVIPINEDSHWYFLVILNPENLLSQDTESPPVVLQPNSYDCGLYVIHCFQKFFTDVDGMMKWINNFENKKLTISPEIIWDAVSLSEKGTIFIMRFFN